MSRPNFGAGYSPGDKNRTHLMHEVDRLPQIRALLMRDPYNEATWRLLGRVVANGLELAKGENNVRASYDESTERRRASAELPSEDEVEGVDPSVSVDP